MRTIEPEAFREALSLHMIFHAAGVDYADIYAMYEATDPTNGEPGLGVMAKQGDLTFVVVVGPHGLTREQFAVRWPAAVEALHTYSDEEAKRLSDSTAAAGRKLVEQVERGAVAALNDSMVPAKDRASLAWPDFVREMRGKQYGPTETRDAWLWFQKGWDAGYDRI